jgi:cytochrome P450
MTAEERVRMSTVLTTDDPLYEQLYDVRKEALEMGNLVEGDMNGPMSALREKGAVHKGFLRELLQLPTHFRYAMAVGRQGYVALTFTACEAAFRNAQQFSSKIAHQPTDGEEQTRGILEMDGQQHRSHRRTLQPMFVRNQTSTWWRERWVNEIVCALIERLRRQKSADLNLEFCARIPVHTITRAIGMSGDDALSFRDAFVKSSITSKRAPEIRMAAAAKVDQMLLDLIARRRAEPMDDLVSGLIAADLELPDGSTRKLTDREIMHHSRIVMVAGGGTSWRQLGITLWALLTHREQLEAVKADRSLVEKAIEESLRWNCTAPVFSRLVVEDAELEGMAIPKDSVLEICMGAANRDPERWENPDAYDLHRRTRGHLAFGVGAHQCLGMNVARHEMSAGINALLDAFPNIKLDPNAPAPCLAGGLEQRGVSVLPVLLNPS